MSTTRAKSRSKTKAASEAAGEVPAVAGQVADLLRSTSSADATETHVYRYREEMFACDTDQRGFATPRGASPNELVLDASDGFIPLWAQGQILRWRFQERSLLGFADTTRVKSEMRRLMGDAIVLWGGFRPVSFSEQEHTWDFEVVVREQDKCSPRGCVLASAFFPDAGRHELVVYPKMFELHRTEQIETMAHEFGHVFGLRHFFAQVSEQSWPSEVFGTHRPFSIMNYGYKSQMTDVDRQDLQRLYESAWSGALTEVNGTEVRFVKPYSAPVDRTQSFEQGWDRAAACVSVRRCGS